MAKWRKRTFVQAINEALRSPDAIAALGKLGAEVSILDRSLPRRWPALIILQLLRVIFLTGGAFTPSARDFLDKVPNRRLEKPFELGNLRKLVNDSIR